MNIHIKTILEFKANIEGSSINEYFDDLEMQIYCGYEIVINDLDGKFVRELKTLEDVEAYKKHIERVNMKPIILNTEMFDSFGHGLYERIEELISHGYSIIIKDSNQEKIWDINTLDDLNSFKIYMNVN